MSSTLAQYLRAQAVGDLETMGKARQEDLEEIVSRIVDSKSKQFGMKHNPTTVSPQGPYVHGPGGLLSYPGQNPTMFSAMIQPWLGMVSAMPRIDSGPIFPLADPRYGGYETPLLSTIMGVTEGDDDWSDQPEEVCDDPPTGGDLKICTQTFEYGRFSKSLKQIDRSNLGRLNNLGETTDFRLMNPQAQDNPLQPAGSQYQAGNWINDEITTRIYNAAVGFQRMLAPLVYSGTPTNNSAGGGRAQFLGFNNIYTTGRVDFISQVACPGMDSLLIAFNAAVTGTNLQGLYLYQVLEEAFWRQELQAETAGLAPVQWQLSMDINLFRELTQIIPIQQYVRVIATINAINGSANGAHLNFSGEQANAARQEMYEGRWIPLMGKRVPVVLENPTTIGTTYTASTNTSTSKIYLHPMTVMPARIPVTYWQFFNFDNEQGRKFDELISKGLTYTTDGGKFLWSTALKNWCGQLAWLAKPRIISHTPQLGTVISGIRFTPTLYAKDAYPSNSSFYFDGGRTYNAPIAGYPQWSDTTQVNVPSYDW